VESSDARQSGREIRLRHSEGFHRDVVALLTDDQSGTMRAESTVTRFGDHEVRVSAAPSNDELLLEIRRLRDIVRGAPDEAESARVQSLQGSVVRERRLRDAIGREFDACSELHHALAAILELWIDIGDESSTSRLRQAPGYDAIIAEVRRLKALDTPS
jgi:hypothetical protein